MGRIIPYIMENKKCLKPPTTYVWASNILGHNLCRKLLAPTPHFMGYPSVHHGIVFGFQSTRQIIALYTLIISTWYPVVHFGEANRPVFQLSHRSKTWGPAYVFGYPNWSVSWTWVRYPSPRPPCQKKTVGVLSSSISRNHHLLQVKYMFFS